jgi:nitrogen fixation NifU-like protein
MFDDVRDLYQDIILRHGRNPVNMRRMENPDAVSSGDNPMCGDRCEVRIRFGTDGQLDDVAFEARGCAISMASADLMVDAVRGRTPQSARTLAAAFRHLAKHGVSDSDDPAIETLKPLSGVSEYPSRIKCATLPWAALVAALDGDKEATSE